MLLAVTDLVTWGKLGGEGQIVGRFVEESGRHGGCVCRGTRLVRPRCYLRARAAGGRNLLDLRYSGGLKNGEVTSIVGEVAHATVFGLSIGTGARGVGG
jgi:hypothetical protein